MLYSQILQTSFPKNRKNIAQKVFVFTLMVLFFLVVQKLLYLLFLYPESINITSENTFACAARSIALVLLYHLSKLAMYTVFILRIKMIFKDGKFQYSNKIFQGYYLILAVSAIIMVVGDLGGGVDGQWIDNQCTGIYKAWGAVASGILDFMLSIIPLYLFIKPLYILLKQAQNNETQS